ncbi:hypothetical protein BC835DRAFT_11491 [Cytidiella melzeri]|nr:hypothetical protein BC835DRAFT_11491 [Cytidiella melzeri]
MASITPASTVLPGRPQTLPTLDSPSRCGRWTTTLIYLRRCNNARSRSTSWKRIDDLIRNRFGSAPPRGFTAVSILHNPHGCIVVCVASSDRHAAYLSRKATLKAA